MKHQERQAWDRLAGTAGGLRRLCVGRRFRLWNGHLLMGEGELTEGRGRNPHEPSCKRVANSSCVGWKLFEERKLYIAMISG